MFWEEWKLVRAKRCQDEDRKEGELRIRRCTKHELMRLCDYRVGSKLARQILCRS